MSIFARFLCYKLFLVFFALFVLSLFITIVPSANQVLRMASEVYVPIGFIVRYLGYYLLYALSIILPSLFFLSVCIFCLMLYETGTMNTLHTLAYSKKRAFIPVVLFSLFAMVFSLFYIGYIKPVSYKQIVYMRHYATEAIDLDRIQTGKPLVFDKNVVYLAPKEEGHTKKAIVARVDWKETGQSLFVADFEGSSLKEEPRLENLYLYRDLFQDELSVTRASSLALARGIGFEEGDENPDARVPEPLWKSFSTCKQCFYKNLLFIVMAALYPLGVFLLFFPVVRRVGYENITISFGWFLSSYVATQLVFGFISASYAAAFCLSLAIIIGLFLLSFRIRLWLHSRR